jgi:hypothetical protein
MTAKLNAFFSAIYNKLGDPRTKNVLLVVLLAMTAFGMVAPESATSMRDTILALALK